MTVVSRGYRKPQAKQTREPTAITGTRPIVSVSLPLKGRERPAVTVNNPMMYPLYAPPPKLLRYEGSSGSSILKLEEKRKELVQSKINFDVKMFWGFDDAILCFRFKPPEFLYNFYFRIRVQSNWFFTCGSFLTAGFPSAI